MINFMLITNDPALAEYAESCGVGRIFVDLEQHGKKERQGHLDTLISSHEIADIARVKSSISKAELLVRVNPLHENTEQEVEESIKAGAQLLMLPMFNSGEEVRQFVEIVGGRTGIVPLVETYAATQCLEDIVSIPGLTEIYIGLNDLHLDMKLDFMFELVANGMVDQLVSIIKKAGLPFGFGGIARVGEGIIPGELVLSEHVRLGSSSVILSRTFHRKSQGVSEFRANLDLKKEMEKLFDVWNTLQEKSIEQLDEEHRKLQGLVKNFVASRK